MFVHINIILIHHTQIIMDQKATPPFQDELFERSKKRKSSQFIMSHSLNKTFSYPKAYQLYHFHSHGDHKIFNGFDSLADWFEKERTVVSMQESVSATALTHTITNLGAKKDRIVKAYIKETS